MGSPELLASICHHEKIQNEKEADTLARQIGENQNEVK